MFRWLTPAALASALFPLAALAAQLPDPHQITCSSTRVARDYQSGLARYHQGRSSEAVEDFQSACRRDPACAMAQWGLSRALQKSGRNADALAAQAKAESLAPGADDREQRLIAAWGKLLKAPSSSEERKRALDGVKSDLDTAVSLYSDDPEVWLTRGEVEPNPLRGVPFYLAALRLQPSHPVGKSWAPAVPPLPEMTPQPTQPIAAPKEIPRLFDGLGMVSHAITADPQARAYYEQGLRCWHAYVTHAGAKNSAARCFQYAAVLDPECAMAYWGLSFCGEVDGFKAIDAANRAVELAARKGTDKERRFAAARLLEMQSYVQRNEASAARRAKKEDEAKRLDQSAAETRERFLDALDGAILAYPDDVELWIWRGKVHGTSLSAIPYQLAAHQLRPEHPSPNHELVHAFEGVDRAGLGWPYTEGFRRSAPNMPHAHHMQAHLAMRLGRWQEALDCTRMSRRKSLEGFPELDPTHHIDILVRALAHEGRFKEAEAEPRAYRNGLPWARLLQLKGSVDELDAWAEARRTTTAADGYYIGAIAKLDRGDAAAALPLIEHVEAQFKKGPTHSNNIYRYNEVKGRYLVMTGGVDEGLKLLREAGAKAVKDTELHAWGGGSYMLEVWGSAALAARRLDEAEEAYHEALAHEHGSVIGALGMQVVSEQRGRSDLAEHYAGRARTIWKGADEGALDRQLSRLRKLAAAPVAANGGAM